MEVLKVPLSGPFQALDIVCADGYFNPMGQSPLAVSALICRCWSLAQVGMAQILSWLLYMLTDAMGWTQYSLTPD